MAEETQEITEGSEGTQEGAQESVEDLRTQISALTTQIGEKDTKIQSLDKAISKRQGYDEGIAKIHERLDTQEGTMAMLADLMEEIRGTEPEQPTPGKVSHQEALKQKREQSPSKPDPDVMKFVSYVDSQGLSVDDELVKEAVGEDRNPKDALKYLRDKVKASQGQDVDKRAKEIAEGLVEQKLKEYGLTAAGAGGPSAPSESWRDLSPEQKILQAVSGK